MSQLRERRVEVSSGPPVELFVAERPGAGTPLLVIHGGPDWDHTYLLDPLVQLQGRRLLFVDLRGCGRSTRGLGDAAYSPEAVTQDLLALLDVLSIDSAAVLGFSYGGLLAQCLAIAAPARVGQLIIASSSVLPVPANAFDGWEERDRRLAEQAAMSDDAAPVTEQIVREMALATVPTNVWNRDLWSAYRERLRAVRFSAEWAKPWVAGTLPSPRPPGGVEALSQLSIPMLLLHGRQDMTFPAALLPIAAALLPRAQVVAIDNAGHMAHVDRPDEWLSAIERFLGIEEADGNRAFGRNDPGG